jgi:hypothetical protein
VKRFLIFALLGPLLGGIVATTIVVPIILVLQGYAFKLGRDELISGVAIYPAAMIFGIVPALLAALADWLLVRVRYRWIYVGLIGMVVGFPAMRDNLQLTATHPWWPIVGGLIGGIPAAVCSRLSNMRTKEGDDK